MTGERNDKKRSRPGRRPRSDVASKSKRYKVKVAEDKHQSASSRALPSNNDSKEESGSFTELTVEMVNNSVKGKVHLTNNDVQVVQSYCKKTLFPLIKFISGDKQMQCDGKIATKVLEGVGASKRHYGETWNLIKSTVTKEVTARRNTINGLMRKEFIRK